MIAHKTGGSVVPAYTVTTTVSGIVWVQFICSEPDTHIQSKVGTCFIFGVDSEEQKGWIEQTVDLKDVVNFGGYTVSYGNSRYDLDVYLTPKEMLKAPSLMKFDVGSVVEVVANTSGHMFKHRQVLVIDKQYPETMTYDARDRYGDTCTVCDDDIAAHINISDE